LIELTAHEAADVVSISAGPFDAYAGRSESQTRKEPQMSNALLIHDLAGAAFSSK
jgi:hypothetical protein